MSWPSLQRYWRTPENQPSTFVAAACDGIYHRQQRGCSGKRGRFRLSIQP